MSLTDDARLVVDSELGPHKFNNIATVSADSWKAAVQLARAVLDAVDERECGCKVCGEPLPYRIRYEGEAAPIDTGTCGPEYRLECRSRQIANLTARLATVSADLAEHKRRLLEQSATLNSVRQSRDEYKRRLLGLEKNADE